MCVCVSVPCLVSVGVFTPEGGASEAVPSRQRQRAHLRVSLPPVCEKCSCACVCGKSLNKVQANEPEGLWNSSSNTYVHLFRFYLCGTNDTTVNRNPVKGLWKNDLRFVMIWLHQFYLIYTMRA